MRSYGTDRRFRSRIATSATRYRPILAGHCVLLYSGNYGIAHEVETVAEGYRLHHQSGSGRVRLWLSASGAGAEDLVKRFTAWKLPFHKSAPVPLDRLPGLLRAPHGHLVTLKDGFVGYVMPSKIYACLDSGLPLIFVGSAASDVDLLTRPRECPIGGLTAENPTSSPVFSRNSLMSQSMERGRAFRESTNLHSGHN